MRITNENSMLESAKWAEMRAWARYTAIIRLVGFVSILCMPFSLWALFWSSPGDYPFFPSMLYVPLVTCCCVLMFNLLRPGDRFVKLLFGVGIAAHLVATGAYVWMGFNVYGGDALDYWSAGLNLAEQFSVVGWAAFHPPYSSSNLVCNICGIITLVTGNALPTLFVIFSLTALLGGYFFYRAFCLAFPQGNMGLYGLLVVLLPSIVFWSSAIGKDALEQLFIGISAYGFARVTKRLDAPAILVCIIGVAGTIAIRPHIGAIVAMSMLVPFAISKTRGGWMTMAAKILLLPLLAAGTLLIVGQSEEFVGMQNNDLASAIKTLNSQQKNVNYGGSSVNEGASLPRRIGESPFIMFRPLPWEVHNAAAGISSLEGMGLLLVCWGKRREFWALLRSWREPYVGFLLLYSLEFSVIVASATGNFGILVRQRIMLLPLALMLFCAKRSAAVVAVRRPVMQRNPWLGHRIPAPLSNRTGC